MNLKGRLTTDIARIGSELDKLKQRVAEDFRKIESDARLDLSLEKGRFR